MGGASCWARDRVFGVLHCLHNLRLVRGIAVRSIAVTHIDIRLLKVQSEFVGNPFIYRYAIASPKRLIRVLGYHLCRVVIVVSYIVIRRYQAGTETRDRGRRRPDLLVLTLDHSPEDNTREYSSKPRLSSSLFLHSLSVNISLFFSFFFPRISRE